MPVSRVKKIQFYEEDGSLTKEKKLLPKEFYSASDRSDIVTRRRQTIISYLIARAIELDLEIQTKDYFGLYKDQTDKYILYGDKEIIEIVSSSTEEFLATSTGLDAPMDTMRSAITICLSKTLETTPNEEVTAFLVANLP